jgi:hypothetical protein
VFCSVGGAAGGLGLLPSFGKYAATPTVPAIKNSKHRDCRPPKCGGQVAGKTSWNLGHGN